MEKAAEYSRKTLHAQVAESLRHEILTNCKPGQKLEAEVSFAKRLGVSPLTLRQAFAALTHEGLIQRRHGSGTYVTGHRQKKTVAVGTETYPGQISNSFQMRVFMLLNELFRHLGYRCRSYIGPFGIAEGWAELAEDVQRGRIDGAAFVAVNGTSIGIPFAEKGVPCVGMGPPYQASVELDYTDLMRKGVRDLLERGCRRIALMQWLGGTPHMRAAFEAFCSVMTEHGAPIRPEWMRSRVSPVTPGAGWEQFLEIWTAREEKPDGLLVTDDMLFRDVALGILDIGVKVPSQLQLVAHANKGSGLTYPFPVTFLEIDPQDYAEAMVDLLSQLMKKETVREPIRLIQARLIPASAQQLPIRVQQNVETQNG